MSQSSGRATGRKRFRVLMVAVAVLAVVVAVLAIALMQRRHMDKSPLTPIADDGKGRVSLFVAAPDLDSKGSRVPLSVTGKTDAGQDVDERVYVNAGSTDAELPYGTYTITVLGSPIASSGVIYEVPSEPVEVVVSAQGATDQPDGEPDDEADDDASLAEVSFELEPLDPQEVTDEQVAEAVSWVREDEERADYVDDLEQAAHEWVEAGQATTMADVAAAYGRVLDDANSYFDAWFNEPPDQHMGARYNLVELSGDDVPELVLAMHYSNVGSHASGGWRMRVFQFNEETGETESVRLPDNEYDLFMEPYNIYWEDPGGHALLCELRYYHGMDSAYQRITVVDGVLTGEDLSESPGSSDYLDLIDVSDRSLLESLAAQDGTVADRA